VRRGWQRIGLVGREALALLRERGLRAAWRTIRRRAFDWSKSLLFVRVPREGDGEGPWSEEWEFLVYEPGQRTACLCVLEALGVSDELGNFDRGAVCVVARDASGTPVGSGWDFGYSRLLERLSYPSDAIYLGGFFVPESRRGQGIYPALLRYMVTRRGGERLAVAQTSLHNLGSQRGLEKAGFVCRGRLCLGILAGVIVIFRMDGASDRM